MIYLFIEHFKLLPINDNSITHINNIIKTELKNKDFKTTSNIYKIKTYWFNKEISLKSDIKDIKPIGEKEYKKIDYEVVKKEKSVFIIPNTTDIKRVYAPKEKTDLCELDLIGIQEYYNENLKAITEIWHKWGNTIKA